MRSWATGLLLAGLLALPRPGSAQVLIGYLFGEKLASEHFNLGFEIGVNFATLDGMGEADRVRKTVFGLFADWRFSEHFHLAGAFLPIAGRGAQGLTPVPTGDPVLDGQITGSSMTRTLGYIEFPVMLKWAPKREAGFRIGVGPSLGLITSANDRYEASTPSATPFVLERDVEDQIGSPDFGVSFDLEWRFPLLAIAARYTHGLTELGAGSEGAVRTRTLTGTGRIYLGKKRTATQPE